MCQSEQKSHRYTFNTIPDSRRRSSAASAVFALRRVGRFLSPVGPPVCPDADGRSSFPGRRVPFRPVRRGAIGPSWCKSGVGNGRATRRRPPTAPCPTEGERGRTGHVGVIDTLLGDRFFAPRCHQLGGEGEFWWALSLALGRCHYGEMAKTVIVKLIDDIDGGDADETVRFSLDDNAFEIDLNSANAARLRSALKPFTDNARATASSKGSRVIRNQTARQWTDALFAAFRRGKGTFQGLGRHGHGSPYQRRQGQQLGSSRKALKHRHSVLGETEYPVGVAEPHEVDQQESRDDSDHKGHLQDRPPRDAIGGMYQEGSWDRIGRGGRLTAPPRPGSEHPCRPPRPAASVPRP